MMIDLVVMIAKEQLNRLWGDDKYCDYYDDDDDDDDDDDGNDDNADDKSDDNDNTLHNREAEFQAWKRRKEYDPLAAARLHS